MASDGHVVVIDKDFHVQLLTHCQARSFGIVAFHLTAIRAQQHDRFPGIRHRNTVDEGPKMAKPARAEFDARRETLLRISREAAAELSVMQQMLYRHCTIENTHKILRGHSVARLVVKDRNN